MAFDISEFRSILFKYGAARPSHYAAYMSPPQDLQDDGFTNDMPYLVDSANLPGINLQTEEIMHKGYGLMEARPTAMTFEPITLTIIGDAQGKVLGFLQNWLSMVTNFDGTSKGSTYQIKPETFNYPVKYWGTIDLVLYDISSKQYHEYKFDKCYPINIGAVDLSWEQQDTMMRIPVSFSYRSYKTTATAALAVSSTQTSSVRDSNARNVQQLSSITPTADIELYKQRLATI